MIEDEMNILKTLKVGRHYRVTHLSLYRSIENHECVRVL